MEPRIPKYMPVVNVMLKFLPRRGIKAGPVSIITVAGRRSGRPQQIGVAPERTPEGFAAAVPYVAVFEVTPA